MWKGITLNWPINVLEYVINLRDNDRGFSWAEITEALEDDHNILTTPDAIRKAVARYQDRKVSEYELPDPTPRRFEKVLTLPVTNFCAIGDVHGDMYNRDLLLRAVDRMQYHDVSTLVIGGDLFNADSLSTHPHNEKITPFHQEMETVGKILAYLGNLPFLDTIVITSGNHCERITRKLNSYLSFQMVIHAALNGKKVSADIIATDLDYCYVNNSWVVGHLSSYNKAGGKLALDLARKHSRHAAVFHDHIQGLQCDNRYIGVSVGAMLQKDAFFYKERRLNMFSDFQNGFLIVDNDLPVLYNEWGTAPISGNKTWEELD